MAVYDTERGIRVDSTDPTGVIGSHWRRREPAGDEHDEVILSGYFALKETVEVAYLPASFGQTLVADPHSFEEVYEQVDPIAEKVANLHQQIAALGIG